MKGPPIPMPPYKGTRFDPPEAWLFAKGIYGPPDNRPWFKRPEITREQARAWGLFAGPY